MAETNGNSGNGSGDGSGPGQPAESGGAGDGGKESAIASLIENAKASSSAPSKRSRPTNNPRRPTSGSRSSASSTTRRRAAARSACSRNVFLHLHPAKINRDAVAYNYTWGMGGITFYLFIVLMFTGMLLMFYYHPTKVVAFRDILYLEHDVPFGKLLRNMHRWARAPDGHHGLAAHVPRVPDRLLQEAAGVQLGGRRDAAGADAAAQLHRLSAARRSARVLGGHGGHEHGARDAAAGPRGRSARSSA